MLERCLASLPRSFHSFAYEAPLRRLLGGSHFEPHGRQFGTESELRDFGRQHAQRVGAKWWLQLDADERLVDGEQLPAILEHWPTPGYPLPRCYPLPRVEEDGTVTFCAYKLVRLPCRLVVGCDHFTFGGLTTWRLSADRSATEQEIPALVAGPHLVHEPSRRASSRRTARIGIVENVLEKRPAHAVAWPLPVQLGGRAMSETEQEAPDAGADAKGAYYCPGCGKRFETPGNCTGYDEAGHAPIAVEKVKGGKADDGDKPKPAAKRKTSSTRKRKTAGASK